MNEVALTGLRSWLCNGQRDAHQYPEKERPNEGEEPEEPILLRYLHNENPLVGGSSLVSDTHSQARISN